MKRYDVKLDDYAYEQGPADEIFKRVEGYLLPGEPGDPAPEARA